MCVCGGGGGGGGQRERVSERKEGRREGGRVKEEVKGGRVTAGREMNGGGSLGVLTAVPVMWR